MIKIVATPFLRYDRVYPVECDPVERFFRATRVARHRLYVRRSAAGGQFEGGPERSAKNEVVQRRTAAIAQSDGFAFITPEYNYGPPAVLKNAIDWVYPEWNRKAAGFVSYGSVMGARGVQQLRQTAIELQLAPIRSSLHIPVATLWAHYTGGDVEAGLAESEAPAAAMIDDLLWWTAALKTTRASAS
jgi:NAD(P)H-dependent FMN reductase